MVKIIILDLEEIMARHRIADKARLKQHWSAEAIALALNSRWEEAAVVNRGIIELFPDDIEAHNRLGKALTELGRYAEAWQAYKHVLEIDSSNIIAKRNFDRLSHLKQVRREPKERQELDLSLFVEETGKTALVELYDPAPSEVLTRMSAGDQVYLKADGNRLIVENGDGEYLGEIEPKLGLRLIKLMAGGNRYQAAIATSGRDWGRVIVKEVFQDPSQAGRLSFPLQAADSFRSYIKDSVLKYELEDEEEWEEEVEEDVSALDEADEALIEKEEEEK
jgi:tetratricopeptide (TPR) repeat protein